MEEDMVWAKAAELAGPRIEDFIDSFFSFLRRRTDFFHPLEDNHGFSEEHRQSVVTRTFLKHSGLAQLNTRHNECTIEGQGLNQNGLKKKVEENIEMERDINGKAGGYADAKSTCAAFSLSTDAASNIAARTIADTEVRGKENNGRGEATCQKWIKEKRTVNGGESELYVFDQTRGELEISFHLRDHAQSKDISMTSKCILIDSDLLPQSVGSESVGCEFAFRKAIAFDDSFWTLETCIPGHCRVLRVFVSKKEECWWEAPFVGTLPEKRQTWDQRVPFDDLSSDAKINVQRALLSRDARPV